jgi:hypothetical protein
MAGIGNAGGRVGLGARNPLGYVGLALAGANDTKAAGPEGGILTGLGIVDLRLEELRLCVLSACETGLGELTDGEGVVGLQRAFHVACCPDVVGSLWKVDDAATAALMTQFYHELWANKRAPREALREAQLAIYRHPERIPALAGGRGKPALLKAAKLGSGGGSLGNSMGYWAMPDWHEQAQSASSQAVVAVSARLVTPSLMARRIALTRRSTGTWRAWASASSTREGLLNPNRLWSNVAVMVLSGPASRIARQPSGRANTIPE